MRELWLGLREIRRAAASDIQYAAEGQRATAKKRPEALYRARRAHLAGSTHVLSVLCYGLGLWKLVVRIKG